MTRGRARGRGAGVGAREEAGLVVGGGLLGGGDAQREHLVPHGVQRLWNHLRPKPRRLRAGCRAQGRRRSGGGTCARAGGGAGGPCSSRSSRRRGRPLRTGPTFPPSPRPAPAPRSRPPAPTCARTKNKDAPPPSLSLPARGERACRFRASTTPTETMRSRGSGASSAGARASLRTRSRTSPVTPTGPPSAASCAARGPVRSGRRARARVGNGSKGEAGPAEGATRPPSRLGPARPARLRVGGGSG